MVSKQEVVNFVKKYYEENGKGPSIGEIQRKFQLAKAHIYNGEKGLFPGGKAEIYRSAGIPYKCGRMREARKAKEEMRVKAFEDLLFLAFDMIFTLYVNRFELKKSLEYPTYLVDLSDDADWEVRDFLERLVELNTAFGKKLLNDNPFLDHLYEIWEDSDVERCTQVNYAHLQILISGDQVEWEYATFGG